MLLRPRFTYISVTFVSLFYILSSTTFPSIPFLSIPFLSFPSFLFFFFFSHITSRARDDPYTPISSRVGGSAGTGPPQRNPDRPGGPATTTVTPPPLSTGRSTPPGGLVIHMVPPLGTGPPARLSPRTGSYDPFIASPEYSSIRTRRAGTVPRGRHNSRNVSDSMRHPFDRAHGKHPVGATCWIVTVSITPSEGVSGHSKRSTLPALKRPTPPVEDFDVVVEARRLPSSRGPNSPWEPRMWT